MIYRLKGTLLDKSPHTAVIDVHGVAFEITISMQTYADLPQAGEPCTLFTHFVIREDGAFLFGFKDMAEKRLFLQLITVSKVGPKMATTILSGMSGEKFREAVVAGDITRLSTIPGIGKKTAERIVVELKDKFDGIFIPAAENAGISRDDVVSALLNLGFKQAECVSVLNKVGKAEDSFDDLLKKALKELSTH